MWPFKRKALGGSSLAPMAQPRRKWKITDSALAKFVGSGRPNFELTPLTGHIRIENVFAPAAPLKGQPSMALDDQFTNILGELNGYGLGGGIGFIGYGLLAELAQRPEYRRGSEVLAREMTRRFIKFTYAGEDEDDEQDEDDEADTAKSPAEAPGESVSQEDAPAQPDDTKSALPFGGQQPDAGDPAMGGAPEAKPAPRVKPSDEKIKKLEAEFKKLKVRDAFRRVAELDGFFGRGHIYIDTGDTDKPDELLTPLLADRRKIRKGKIKRLTVVEPQWIYPQQYNTSDPLKSNFFQPQQWLVMAKPVHASRILTFVGREVPDLLKPAYSFGGLSLTQMAQPYVDNWLRTRQSVSDLLHAFTVWGVKTDMQAMLSGADDSDELIKRAKLFNQARDNRGLMMIDKENEDFFNISVPLGGLDKLQAQAQEQMASVFAIPLVVLLGITPSGLNASSDGEIRVFYDFINAFQQHLFGHALERLLRLIQLSLFGEIDEDIGFEFLPLWQPTEVDQASIRKSKMEVDTGYVNAGVLDPVEVRDTLAADKEGDYNNIDVSQVPEDPNALPPGMNPITGEMAGEESDDPAAPGGDDDDTPPSPFGGTKAPKPAPAGGSPKPIATKPIPSGASDAVEFKEGDHPRAENGQFGSGGGGGASGETNQYGETKTEERSRLLKERKRAKRMRDKAANNSDYYAWHDQYVGLNGQIEKLEAEIGSSPKQAKAAATEPAPKRDRPPFDAAEVAKLPDSKAIRQPAKDWPEFQAKGDEGRKQFVDALGPVTKLLNLRTDVALPENLTDEDLDGGDNFLFVAPNKSEARTRNKVDTDYNGDWSQLKDMIRGSITVSSMDDLRDAVLAVEEAGLEIAAKPKDKFTKPTAEGYRDLNTLMKLPNGMYAELQFHLTPMIAAKNEAHDYYAIQQELCRKNGNMEEPDDTWSSRDTQKFNDMRTRQRELYGSAWERVTGGV